MAKEQRPLLSFDLKAATVSSKNTSIDPRSIPKAFEFTRCKHYQPIGGGPFAPEPFHVLNGEDGPPNKSHADALECVGSDYDQYTDSNGPCDACFRVMCHNPPTGDKTRRARITELRKNGPSLIGVNGHLERMNAWIHLSGAVLFFAFATARPLILDTASIAGILSTITSAVVMVTFLVSTGYHALGTIGRLAPIMRTLDHGAIYVALACATVTDTAVTTFDFKDVPWQTPVDAIGVAALLLAFFCYRRVVLPPSETVVAWGSCKLGLFRLQHADKDHSALRSSGYVILSFGFISLIPATFQNLTYDMARVLIIGNTISVLLLVGGLLLDNVLVWPDVWYQSGRVPSTICHSKEMGCICTSHAWWHLLSLFSVVALTAGREIVIAHTLEGRAGSGSWSSGNIRFF
jgi:predicted membrane channel-forming protein YqfA (hemolysin III family)